ncbi:hypothetical protein BURMUCF2_1088 [Burkholderia multivorans CF2]|nr:hypothetical protein BURMUCF2_1088 [Burkholderia multivorans CF2]
MLFLSIGFVDLWNASIQRNSQSSADFCFWRIEWKDDFGVVAQPFPRFELVVTVWIKR